MDNNIAKNALKEALLKAQLLAETALTKRHEISAQIKQYHHDVFQSQKAVKSGDNSTGSGKQLKDVANRSNSDSEAFFSATTRLMLASIPNFFNQTNWQSAANLFKSVFAGNGATATSGVIGGITAPYNYAMSPIKVEEHNVSSAFKMVVQEHIDLQILNATATAPSVFNALANNYALPLRPEIIDAFEAANGNEVEALRNIEQVTLSNNGVCFSSAHDNAPALCAETLQKLRTEYEAKAGRNASIGNPSDENIILTYKETTPTFTFASSTDTTQGLNSLLEHAPDANVIIPLRHEI